MYKRYLKLSWAFTLAEVLIALGIIGIVAALVAPGVMINIERQRNAAILQRAYGDLQNYVYMFASEYNCTSSLAECVPDDGQFVYEFSKYLYEKQGFKDRMSRCKDNPSPNCNVFLRHNPNSQLSGITLTQVFSVTSPVPGRSRYIMSPTGLYAYVISVFMYDNYYNVKGDKFRARIHIATDMNRSGELSNGFGDAGNKKYKYPQMGRNLFEVYVMNSKKVIPNGTSICANIPGSWAYYCHELDSSSSGNCSYDSGDFSACMQQVINDGWKIKYKY